MIYIKGLKAKELGAIVDFIYHGETNIFQDDLDDFLAIAQDLQLKGLARSENSNSDDAAESILMAHGIKKRKKQFMSQRNRLNIL